MRYDQLSSIEFITIVVGSLSNMGACSELI